MLDELRIDLGMGAVMVKRRDGGPIRFVIDGGKQHTTHVHNSAKSGNILLPAESDGEYAAMWLLDASLWALRYMAQPHRLEFPMNGRKRLAEYTPDFEMLAPLLFVRELESGGLFARSILKLPPARAARAELVSIVFEFKGRKDRRAQDRDYIAKLEEAKRIYHRHGVHFFVFNEVPHLTCVDHRHLPSIAMDQSAALPDSVFATAWDYLAQVDGVSTYSDIIEALGGGPSGREAAHWLHMKGAIWIDLVEFPRKETRVAMPPLLKGRRAPLDVTFLSGR
ncbi:hypothetical protein HFO68_08180 [Rhizobium laguerreae]|uniref:hypothetical protein n=1 Tax=Rhizobium laguerreae TaxID=1076926 RepID=UPI001C9284F2|nr:hypothetical protein [Rhizobium laguerreae]MBY3104527.1 hypothetical protein [Rhizobium laguerreae]